MLRIEAGNMRTATRSSLINTHGKGTWKDVNFIPVSSRFAFGIPRGIVGGTNLHSLALCLCLPIEQT
jgi:hypothetical protein